MILNHIHFIIYNCLVLAIMHLHKYTTPVHPARTTTQHSPDSRHPKVAVPRPSDGGRTGGRANGRAGEIGCERSLRVAGWSRRSIICEAKPRNGSLRDLLAGGWVSTAFR